MSSISAINQKADENEIISLINSLKLSLPEVFVDVGANARADMSAPYIKDGWRALMVEPQPTCIANLRSLFGSNNKVTIEQCGCSSEPGQMQLHLGRSAVDAEAEEGLEVATLYKGSDPWMDRVRSDKTIDIRVETLTDLLDRHKFQANIGILKIDTEGWDHKVLLGLDFNRYQPGVIVSESYWWDIDGSIAKHVLLEDKGYVNIGYIGANSVWAHRMYGVRWSYSTMRSWLARISRYPTSMGGAFATSVDPLHQHPGVKDF